MKFSIAYNNRTYIADMSTPIDISIPLIPGNKGPNCFWAPTFEAKPVIDGDWIGDTTQGGNLNFKTVRINPHGNGTHTECVGHISKEKINIIDVLTNFHHIAQVVTIQPIVLDNGDRVITLQQIENITFKSGITALIIRTIPNTDDKLSMVYTDTNPPYTEPAAIAHIVNQGVLHLLLDLPSVDREQDEGKLSAHKTFWNYPSTIDMKKTITEMIYVPNAVKDGLYLLNLQIASFALDASPSKPILYPLLENK
ncbi:MAG: cyclase family protein [Saprospiraceae bacterium]